MVYNCSLDYSLDAEKYEKSLMQFWQHVADMSFVALSSESKDVPNFPSKKATAVSRRRNAKAPPWADCQVMGNSTFPLTLVQLQNLEQTHQTVGSGPCMQFFLVGGVFPIVLVKSIELSNILGEV